jgi:prepilin-type N-terminal cleavage/methylation domain-containing protein
MFHPQNAISSNKGFTLLELLVVAIIIALLALIAAPHYMELKREALAQEAYMQLSTWGDVCILRAIRAYETTPKGSPTEYPNAPEKPAGGQYFQYSHNSGTVEDITLTATGIKGDILNSTLAIHVRVINGKPFKIFGGSLY